MRRRTQLAHLLLLASLAPGAQASPRPAQDTAPGWAAEPAPARLSTLPGGARCLRLQNLELGRAGLVEGCLVFRVGSVHDPRGREGLVSLLTASLVQGGSVTWSGEQLAAWLTAHGARLEAHNDLDSIELSFSVPPEHFDGLLERLVSLLVSPAYPERRLTAAKAELAHELQLREQAPQSVAADLMQRLALGKESPWSRTPSAASLDAVQRMEVLGFHRAYLGQSTLTLGLSAGAEPRDLVSRSTTALTRVGRAAAPPAVAEPVFARAEATPLWLVDAPDLELVEVSVGTPVPVDEASVRALELWVRGLNLPGGDDAALRSAQRRLQGLHFERIKVQHSLWPFGWFAAGRVPVAEAVDACEAALDALSGHPRRSVPTEPLGRVRGELEVVHTPREQLAESTRDVAAGLSVHARRDELERMGELDGSAVARAVHTRLAQRPPVVVVVGPVAELYAPLGLLGPVAVHSALRNPRGSPEGLALRARMLEVLGGEKRWAQLIGVRMEGEQRSVGSERPTDVVRWRDFTRSMLRYDQEENGLPATVVATPTGGWHRILRSVYDLPESRHARLVYREARQFDQVLHDLASNPALEVRLGHEGRLDVFEGNRRLCWIVVADTGLPTSLGFDEETDDPGLQAFSDWREEQGYIWPANVVRETDKTTFRWSRFEPIFTLTHPDYARPMR